MIPSKEICNKYYYIPESNLGCTLAHIKVWKNIKKSSKINNYEIKNYSIILEDDAYLAINKNKFKSIIKKIINKYGNKFHIYKLHSDFNNGFTSTASYIINHKKLDETIKNTSIILGHIDFDLYIQNLLNKIIIYTHHFNIFKTDETTSNARKNKYNILNIFDNIYLSSRSDKSLKHILSYKVIKLYNYNFIVFELFIFFLLIILILLNKKYIFLIIIIILLV